MAGTCRTDGKSTLHRAEFLQNNMASASNQRSDPALLYEPNACDEASKCWACTRYIVILTRSRFSFAPDASISPQKRLPIDMMALMKVCCKYC